MHLSSSHGWDVVNEPDVSPPLGPAGGSWLSPFNRPCLQLQCYHEGLPAGDGRGSEVLYLSTYIARTWRAMLGSRRTKTEEGRDGMSKQAKLQSVAEENHYFGS